MFWRDTHFIVAFLARNIRETAEDRIEYMDHPLLDAAAQHMQQLLV
jgi:hypothetical protein